MTEQHKIKSNDKVKDNVIPMLKNDENLWYNGGNGGGGNMNKYVTKEELQKEFELFDSKMDTKFAKLETTFEKGQTSNLKWMITTAIAAVATLAAIL